MTERQITILPLTRAAFAPFGTVIAADDATAFPINDGHTMRHHDLARPQIAEGGGDSKGGGYVALSIFAHARAVRLPLILAMMERHPLGSQAFVPMNGARLVVTVAQDVNGRPGLPQAFITTPEQGIQYDRNCWHGVLAPLSDNARFLVIDRAGGRAGGRAGDGDNLEEHLFAAPYHLCL